MEKIPNLRTKVLKFKSEHSAVIFLTAIVSSIGSMIVAPLSIVMGFWLNDYLARPVLSIEYAELIPHIKEVEPPKQQINDLLKSAYFQSNVLNGKAGNANNLATYTSLERVSAEDFAKMTETTSKYLDLIKKRKTDLKEYTRTLGRSTLSEKELSKVVEQYNTVSGESKISFQKPDDIANSLIPKINNEVKSIDETAQIAGKLMKKLSQKSKAIDRLYFRLNVQNRGNTDGLVRAKGSVEFAGLNDKLSIVSCLPPTKKKPALAIAVTIADDTPEPIRSTSVGKIEKNTLSEFWYYLDVNNLGTATKNTLEQFDSSKGVRYTIHLLDHENRSISRSFPIITKK